VVGVVGDVRHGSLTGDARGEIYKPFWQTRWNTSIMTFTIRTAGSPESLANPAREIVLRADPGQAVYDVMTMEDRVNRSLDATQGLTWLLGVFGVSALLLSSLGIFGVISYAVSQRRHEMGIRVALGADRGALSGMVIRQGLFPVGVGILLGGTAAVFLVRTLADLLYEVDPLDPATFVTVPLLLLLVGLLAVYIPARRASALEAVETLRSD
jgi:putative ABC transport system permease protein